MLDTKNVRAYLILVILIICGLAVATVTATKVVHIGVNFPFSNIVFSIFTYPLVDCICEIWGKKIARQTVWLALAGQLIIVLLLQLSIVTPHATFWTMQHAYQTILSTSGSVVIASMLAFIASQFLDIFVYQKIKDISRGKWLWLRSNLSTFLGQFVDSIIFAMANPIPEIMPDEAKAAGARIVATGRSDFPNQVNNCLGFPAIFKGALKVRASQINEEMKLAAAYALASLISEDELNDENVIADVFDPRVVERESEAVAKAAIESGVARI